MSGRNLIHRTRLFQVAAIALVVGVVSFAAATAVNIISNSGSITDLEQENRILTKSDYRACIRDSLGNVIIQGVFRDSIANIEKLEYYDTRPDEKEQQIANSKEQASRFPAYDCRPILRGKALKNLPMPKDLRLTARERSLLRGSP
jgi:hypothetical protein